MGTEAKAKRKVQFWDRSALRYVKNSITWDPLTDHRYTNTYKLLVFIARPRVSDSNLQVAKVNIWGAPKIEMPISSRIGPKAMSEMTNTFVTFSSRPSFGAPNVDMSLSLRRD